MYVVTIISLEVLYAIDLIVSGHTLNYQSERT